MDNTLDLNRRAGLPETLRVLVEEIPRDAWEAHPEFGGLVAFWLERHAGFRRICEVLRRDAEAAADGTIAPEQMQARLGRYGNMLVQELHGHHQIEDMHYFPILKTRDPALARGFAILDRDHHAMDGLLARFAEGANGVLRGTGEAGAFREDLAGFEGLLLRHLADEEDLIVPVILKHGLDGLH